MILKARAVSQTLHQNYAQGPTTVLGGRFFMGEVPLYGDQGSCNGIAMVCSICIRRKFILARLNDSQEEAARHTAQKSALSPCRSTTKITRGTSLIRSTQPRRITIGL
jgi:hypothetical protein